MKRTASIAIVAAAIAGALVPVPRSAVERWYSSLAYPAIQRLVTPLSNLFPFALFDALLAGGICVLAVLGYRRVRAAGWTRGLRQCAITIVVAAAAAYLVFLCTWGLNYRRVPLVEKVVFDSARVHAAAARQLGDASAAALNRSYAAAHRQPVSLDALAAPFQDAVRALGGRVPVALGRPKDTLLGGYFHEVSVSGMTDPFFLETLLAPDLLDVERPFVVAHEWAHLAGYADESEANFVAWLACRHGDEAAQYSAALAMIGYVRPSRPLRDLLDVGPRSDLWAIQYRYTTTSPTLRVAARQGYDAYLKANRVDKGVESYDAVVQLILGSAMDASGYPLRR